MTPQTSLSLSTADLKFLARFEAQELSVEEWTHQAHLRVALAYLASRSFDEAYDCVRRGIQALNLSHGRTVGYHEALTMAYMTVIHSALENGSNHWGSCDQFLATHDTIAGSGFAAIRPYYSMDHLKTDAARDTFVQPDLVPLPAVGKTDI